LAPSQHASCHGRLASGSITTITTSSSTTSRASISQSYNIATPDYLRTLRSALKPRKKHSKPSNASSHLSSVGMAGQKSTLWLCVVSANMAVSSAVDMPTCRHAYSHLLGMPTPISNKCHVNNVQDGESDGFLSSDSEYETANDDDETVLSPDDSLYLTRELARTLSRPRKSCRPSPETTHYTFENLELKISGHDARESGNPQGIHERYHSVCAF